MAKNVALWVFGYGSLIWRPDMPYVCAYWATAHQWARRFWQGSHDHRGTVDAPGRVLTLVPLVNAHCHGRVFGIPASEKEATLAALDYREKNGYERCELDVTTKELGDVTALTYVAPEHNEAWLGDASIHDISAHINTAKGPSGTNRDYVLSLHAALQSQGIDDEHISAVAETLLAMR